MKCPTCHSENRDDSRFCRICGRELPSTDETSLIDTESLEQSTRAQVIGGLFAGRYRLLEQIGKGGMGVVYKAHDTKLKRYVALKFLPTELTRDTEAKKRFIHEAQTASGLDHPNICNIHEIHEAAGGQLFISMACYEGETVGDKIKRGPLEIEEALHIAAQVAEGLKETHKKGIVHRDIKPGNIIVKTGGEVKIMDFGLAKLAGERDLTKTGTTVGTVAYMSPEQARGREVDHRTDIWSLGVVLHQMLTGQQPFKGEKAQAIIYSILNEKPVPVTELMAGIPRELEEVVSRCLKKDPAERYQSVAELSAALKSLRRDVSSGWVSTGRTTASARFAGTQGLRRMLLPAAVAVVAAVLILGLGTERLRNILGVGPGTHLAAMQVAILPWELAGGDVGDRALCDGMTKTLTDRLAELERFRSAFSVVPSRTVQTLRRAGPVDARRELGANVAITGTMHRSGERLTLNLVRNDIGTEVRDRVDTETLKQRKAPPISDPIANLATWEDSLPIRLVDLLDLDLKPEERRLLIPAGTALPSAYELHLQGTGYLYPYEGPEDVDAGIRSFELAIGQDPSYTPAYLGLGYAYLRKYLGTRDSQWSDLAVLSCETALEKCGSLPEIHAGLGRIYRSIGDYAQAAAHFEQAVEGDSTDFRLRFDLGYAYEVQGLTEPAEASYREALRLRPGHLGALDHLGYLCLRQGKYEDAVKLLRKLITLEPGRSKGYTNLGIAYFALDHLTEAEGMFEQALANADTTYAVCSNLGTIYYWQNRYADAARMYRIALTKNDADYKVWGNLAGCYYWMPGESEKAQANFEIAVQLAGVRLQSEPDNPEVLSDLASYYAIMGNRPESERILDYVVALEPADPIMIFRIAETYEQLGERELALKWIGQALERGAPAVKVRRYPGLRELRADPRYRELLDNVGGK
jgi:Flp pilus assembly protein TadD/tRNA A-37 threonylcarbamoyl transferase component Bud32/TolB-like protein